MPQDRFFVEESFVEGAAFVLPEEEVRHLQVMRSQVGEVIELVNGQNQLARAKLLRLEKKRAEVEVLSVEEGIFNSGVILCQALPRLNRLDWIVEKGTELGMAELWLFPGVRSEKKALSPMQWERLKKISIAAMKQCGRLDLPKLLFKPPLSEWSVLPQPAYFGDTRSDAPSIGKGEKPSLFVIGPERGLTQEEMAHLKELGAKGIKLHSNILRTETAALVALVMASIHD